jgi:hypothetical protein
VRCWGDNTKGGADPASPATRIERPTLVAGVADATAIALTDDASCALVRRRAVVCWGNVPQHRGRGPFEILERGVVQLVGGRGHCARFDDETVRCFPRTDWSAPFDTAEEPFVEPRIAGVAELVASSRATCARDWAGSIRCWGAIPCKDFHDLEGCVGSGALRIATTDTELCTLAADGAVRCQEETGEGRRLALPPSIDLASGHHHVCALGIDEEVRCWFRPSAIFARPTEVPKAEVEAWATPHFGCQRRDDGTVLCHARDVSHVIDDASGAPIVVTRLAAHATAGLLEGGGVLAWSLPDDRSWPGDKRLAWTPATRVEGLNGVVDLASPYGYAFFAVLADGSVSYEPCEKPSCRPSPDLLRRKIDGFASAFAIAATATQVCALDRDGGVARCFGWMTPRGGEPTRALLLPGLRGATAIAAGALHFCAIVGGGHVACWGGGDRGQLGDGTLASRGEPRLVEGLADVLALQLGDDRSCAELRDGGFRCWGHLGAEEPSRYWVTSEPPLPKLGGTLVLRVEGIGVAGTR